jgi:hypothetical protein
LSALNAKLIGGHEPNASPARFLTVDGRLLGKIKQLSAER